MDIAGATLAAAAMRAGLIDEYAIVTHPVLVGGGTPFFTALDNWVNLNLVETRTFPDGVLLTRYETRVISEPPVVAAYSVHMGPHRPPSDVTGHRAWRSRRRSA
jgi:hypothetical protein